MKGPMILIVMIVTACVAADSFGQAPPAGSVDYQTKCQMCHGVSGLADTGPAKTLKVQPLNSATVEAKSDATLTGIIKSGSGKMPAFQGKLTDDEINNLVKYIHQLQAKQN